MTRRERDMHGFTLVELLVAITILAIVAVLGWRGLDSIVRSRVSLTQQMDHNRGSQLAFAQMQSDLEQLAGADSVGTRRNLVADNQRLIFVRTVAPEAGATLLVVVSYRVRDGVLTRRESAGTRELAQLDALWQAALSDSDPARGVALQSDVTGMAVRLWRDDAWQLPDNTGSTSSATGSTGSTTTTTTTTGVPTGLEMSLRLRSEPNPLVKVMLLGAT